jgi:hypothetical protein
VVGLDLMDGFWNWKMDWVADCISLLVLMLNKSAREIGATLYDRIKND